MRSLILFLAMLFCATAHADPIPSAASGVYVAPDKVCRVVFARHEVSWLRAELTCMAWSGDRTSMIYRLYAPGAGACWPQSVAVPFNANAPVDYVAFVHYFDQDAGALGALVGNEAEVINGDGSAQKWVRVATLPSPAPYTCGDVPPAATPPQVWRDERVCRLTGRLCGG
jgi:hypothetical protein